MILAYLKSRRAYIAVFILFTVIYSLITFLYGAPFVGVFYSAVLCLFFFCLYGARDFLRFKQKHKELVISAKNLETAVFSFTQNNDLIESDYIYIITQLRDSLNELSSAMSSGKKNINDFYALWVHQIKTPIAAMSLLIQQIGVPQRAALTQELFKVEQYTEMVLSYLRLDDISTDLSFAECSLMSIARQAVKKYAPIFINKAILVELIENDIKVITDEKWLCFAIEQILSNSLKYTNSKGTVKLYVENNYTLVIEDNGMGIDLEDLPRIFEKGFTGYNGRMDKKATGIGLYLTKLTLDRLGHKISVFSHISKGTRVEIDLSRDNIRFE